jgi:uncharacterized protein YndB with AHSA1/START domain
VAVHQTEAVEREVQIAARPETVFEFFTDPEKQVLWMGRKAELDARPGGIYDVEISDQAHALGEFVEVVSPSRVVFTFGWKGQEADDEGEHAVPPGSSRVEVTLEPTSDGTLVRLRHLDLPEQARAMHGQGWELYLGRLAIAASGGDPGPDPNLTAG